ncbi:MAG: FtsX-like permease family protein [Candidatus Brocadiaceae bacterium]|nr:FtsX-like permease family protein [Candidatus Brocadiaceae bacterium]
MKVIFLLAYRSLIFKKTRTLSNIIAVAIGIALITAIVTIDTNTVLTKKYKKMSEYGHPDIEVRLGDISQITITDILKKLESISGVYKTTPIFTKLTQITLPDGSKKQIELCGIKKQDYSHFRTLVLESSGEDIPLEKNQTWITRRFANENKLEVGSRIKIENEECEVVAIASNLFMGRRNRERVGFVQFDWGMTIYQKGGYEKIFPVFWVKTNEKVKTLMRKLEGAFLVNLPSYMLEGNSVEDLAMRNALKVSSIFSLGLGLFIIFHSFTLSVVERVREIGLMHAIGLTKRYISIVLLTEALIIGVIGAICGVLSGLVLAKIMAHFGISTVGFAKIYYYYLPWKQIIFYAALGICSTLAGAIYPIFKARNVNTSLVIHPIGTTQTKVEYKKFYIVLFLASNMILIVSYICMKSFFVESSFGLFATIFKLILIVLFFIGALLVLPSLVKVTSRLFGKCAVYIFKNAGTIAYKDMSASGDKLVPAILGIVIVFAAIFAFKTLTTSLKEEIKEWWEIAIDGKVLISTKELPVTIKNDIQEIEGVKHVLMITSKVDMPFTIKGIDLSSLITDNDIPESEKEIIRRFTKGEGIILTTSLASRLNKKAGEFIKLPTVVGKKNIEIIGVSDRYGYFFFTERTYALMSSALMRELFLLSCDMTTEWIIWTDDHNNKGDNISTASLVRKIKSDLDLPITRHMTDSYLIRERARNVDRDFFIFNIIFFCMVILAMIGVLNSLMVNAIEREKEIALLRVLGMTRLQLQKMFTAIGFIIGINGGIFSILLAVPFSYFSVTGLKDFSGLDLEYTISPLWICICMALAVFVSYLASLYPSYVIARENVSQALKYE